MASEAASRTVAQRGLAAEDALEIGEVVVGQHPDDGGDAGGVGEDADAVVALEQLPAEPVLLDEAGRGNTQPGAIVQCQAALLRLRLYRRYHGVHIAP